jgi:hypothetical protein
MASNQTLDGVLEMREAFGVVRGAAELGITDAEAQRHLDEGDDHDIYGRILAAGEAEIAERTGLAVEAVAALISAHCQDEYVFPPVQLADAVAWFNAQNPQPAADAVSSAA